MKLRELALARSGDKGNRATLSVVALRPQHYPVLAQWLTAETVQACYAGVVHGQVRRFELPQLGALHFVMDDALGGGVTRSLALDAHGKSLSSVVLDLNLNLNLDLNLDLDLDLEPETAAPPPAA